MARILCLDPGLSTGLCSFVGVDYEADTDNPFDISRIEFELDWQRTLKDGIHGWLHWAWANSDYLMSRTDVIVYERFVIDGTHTGVWSPQIEGSIITLANMWGIKTIPQLRSDKATLFHQKYKGDKGQTERFQWLRNKGYEGVSHELDAISHGLIYLKRQKNVPTLKMIMGEA